MEQRGRRDPSGRTRELLDRAGSEAGEILDRTFEGRERGPPRLVWDRDRHVGSAGQRFEQRPLGRSQILEAVREDRLAVPGVEIPLKALDCRAPEPVPISEAEPVELCAVRPHEAGQIAVESIRIEKRGVELGERGEQSVGEAARGGRRAEAL